MPEKVRRIKKKKNKKPARWKKRVFFILVVVVAIGIGFIFLQNTGNTLNKEQKPLVKDTTAVAAVCTQAGCTAVNKQAIAFEHISRPSGNLLFRIDIPEQKEETNIAETPISPKIMQELIFLRKQLAETTNVHLTTASSLGYNKVDFDVETQDGWVLRVSTANNANATLEVLRRTLNEIGERRTNLDYIDLRIPNRVYYMFK